MCVEFYNFTVTFICSCNSPYLPILFCHLLFRFCMFSSFSIIILRNTWYLIDWCVTGPHVWWPFIVCLLMNLHILMYHEPICMKFFFCKLFLLTFFLKLLLPVKKLIENDWGRQGGYYGMGPWWLRINQWFKHHWLH